jgi:hypothetical protein|tara:strand:- start:17884 stop:18138 length:255 start_codon:yes stop_codon:yes gene_type:complete
MIKAVGVKVYIKKDLCGDKDFKNFLENVTCDISGLHIGDQKVECKYYDEETGGLYLHFDVPVPKDCLDGFFSDEDIIPELSTIE